MSEVNENQTNSNNIEESEDGRIKYTSYETDNLMDLHDNLKSKFKLNGVMNLSTSYRLVSMLFQNLFFFKFDDKDSSDNENDINDTEEIILENN